MNTKKIVKYRITGRTGGESNPNHFSTLGMKGRPKVEISNGRFSITGSSAEDMQDKIFVNTDDLQILKESLRDAMTRCNCPKAKIEVSLHLVE